MFVARPSLHLLLLVGDHQHRRLPRPHDGVLAGHSPAEGTLQLGAQCQLGKVVHLVLVQEHALVRELRVLHALEPVDNGPDLGRHAVGAEDGRGDGRRRHAECAVPDRGAVLGDARIRDG